ncbi:acyltransferase family protein [Roseateles paludis]|uniref:Acyltransferase n=1 Tax=Roseateles paludis TaxID=3145238 RepID=A0ABV0G6R7_9BURK
MKRLDSLQILRGIAACAVTLHHAVAVTERFVGATGPLAGHSPLGLLGVDLFFVLSGFIILNSHFDDPQGFAAAWRYAVKRLLRIFVPYLPITLVYATALSAMPGLSDSGRSWSLVSSLTLLPMQQPPVLLQAWTLVHELLFYGVFLAFFASRMAFAWLVLAWGTLLLIAPNGWLQETPLPVVHRLMAPLNLEFCLGMAAAWALRRFDLIAVGKALATAGFALLMVLVLLTSHIQQDVEANRLYFGVGFTVLIVGLAAWESKSSSPPYRGQSKRWVGLLVWLGDSSYSQYLVHFAVVSVVARVASKVVQPGLAIPVVGVCLALVIVVTAVYYAQIERRGVAATRAWIGARRAASQ